MSVETNPQSPGPDHLRPRFVLASGSPRRHDLLREAGFDFLVEPADLDESQYPPGLSPPELATWLAVQKAQAIAHRFPDAAVLGADTVVVLGDRILGKPADAPHAHRMLKSLSGTTHHVVTGVAIVRRRDNFFRHDAITSSVQMRPMSEHEISDYVATGNWQGKAGGYGIQDRDPFVTQMGGDLTNIVGLPMQRTRELLAQAGITPRSKG